jgi:hypothetical protein
MDASCSEWQLLYFLGLFLKPEYEFLFTLTWIGQDPLWLSGPWVLIPGPIFPLIPLHLCLDTLSIPGPATRALLGSCTGCSWDFYAFPSLDPNPPSLASLRSLFRFSFLGGTLHSLHLSISDSSSLLSHLQVLTVTSCCRIYLHSLFAASLQNTG